MHVDPGILSTRFFFISLSNFNVQTSESPRWFGDKSITMLYYCILMFNTCIYNHQKNATNKVICEIL